MVNFLDTEFCINKVVIWRNYCQIPSQIHKCKNSYLLKYIAAETEYLKSLSLEVHNLSLNTLNRIYLHNLFYLSTNVFIWRVIWKNILKKGPKNDFLWIVLIKWLTISENHLDEILSKIDKREELIFHRMASISIDQMTRCLWYYCFFTPIQKHLILK